MDFNIPGGLWYMIEGINPQPWEASEAQIVGKRKLHFHKTKQLEFYQRAVADSFTTQNPTIVKLGTGVPLRVFFLFWREIEIIEGNGSKIAQSAVADTTNLQKALEDALQNILYGNDQANVDVRSRIVEQAVGIKPRIMIYIAPDPGMSPEEQVIIDQQFALMHKDEPAPPSNILPNSGDDLF